MSERLPNVPTPQESAHHELHDMLTEQEAELARLRERLDAVRKAIEIAGLDYKSEVIGVSVLMHERDEARLDHSLLLDDYRDLQDDNARLRERVTQLEERLALNDQSALETTLLMMERESERDKAREDFTVITNMLRKAVSGGYCMGSDQYKKGWSDCVESLKSVLHGYNDVLSSVPVVSVERVVELENNLTRVREQREHAKEQRTDAWKELDEARAVLARSISTEYVVEAIQDVFYRLGDVPADMIYRALVKEFANVGIDLDGG